MYLFIIIQIIWLIAEPWYIPLYPRLAILTMPSKSIIRLGNNKILMRYVQQR